MQPLKKIKKKKTKQQQQQQQQNLLLERKAKTNLDGVLKGRDNALWT